MLDPLTALSLAASVVQFVEFGGKLISKSHEIYISTNGATKENATIGEVTADIKSISRRLVKQSDTIHGSSPDEVELTNLANSCEELADDLLRLLANLKVAPGASKWEAFKKAVLTARKEGHVQDLEKRLGKVRKQVTSRLQYMMAYVHPQCSESD